MSSQGKTILLVDDEQEIIDLLTRTFEKHVDHIEVARNGHDAFEILEKNEGKFSCIISDIMMPKGSGLTLLRMIREKNVTTPFLFYTAYSDPQLTLQALDLGALAVVRKGRTKILVSEFLNLSQSAT